MDSISRVKKRNHFHDLHVDRAIYCFSFLSLCTVEIAFSDLHHIISTYMVCDCSPMLFNAQKSIFARFMTLLILLHFLPSPLPRHASASLIITEVFGNTGKQIDYDTPHRQHGPLFSWKVPSLLFLHFSSCFLLPLRLLLP